MYLIGLFENFSVWLSLKVKSKQVLNKRGPHTSRLDYAWDHPGSNTPIPSQAGQCRARLNERVSGPLFPPFRKSRADDGFAVRHEGEKQARDVAWRHTLCIIPVPVFASGHGLTFFAVIRR